MGNGVGKGPIDYISNLSKSIDAWLNDSQEIEKEKHKTNLKNLFVVKADNNASKTDKITLQTKASELDIQIADLEAKMAELAKQIEEHEQEIARHTKGITNLITQATQHTKALEEEQKNWVDRVVQDVIKEVENGIVKKDNAAYEMGVRIKAGPVSRHSAKLDAILINLANKQDQVQSLIDMADGWQQNKKLLENRYKATKTTYDLLNETISKIGSTDKVIKNNDFDKSAPVYSPQKVAVINKISEENYVEAGINHYYIEGSQKSDKTTLDDIENKYKDLFNAEQTSEAYSSTNKAVENLGKALNFNGDNTGLIEDLAKAGLSQYEAAEFIVEKFANAKVALKGNTIDIPWGHDTQAHNIYQTLSDKLVDNYNQLYSGFLGEKNTWDEYCGNTIDSNKQIENISENYSAIIEKMQASGFTFKEAMYAMFDSDKGIFRNSGIKYDINSQSENNLNYSIDYAGDKETAEMYEQLSEQIYQVWGVKPSNIDGKVISAERTGDKLFENKTDPIWFALENQDNKKFSFVIDRNNDGKFDGKNEFVGALANEGTSWLDDLKSLDSNGDGVLSGDELKALKVLETTYNQVQGKEDYHEYAPGQVESKDKGYVRESETKIEYALQNTFSMGIEEINLNGLENKVTTQAVGEDINGSSVYADSFNFNLNGQEVTAHRLDEKESYMEKAYVFDKSFELGLTEEQVNKAFASNYVGFDSPIDKYTEIFANIETLKATGALAAEVAVNYIEAKDNATRYGAVELNRAANKIATEKNVAGWETIEKEIEKIASKQSISIDMTQAKGIYVLKGIPTAQGIIEEYNLQKQEREKAVKDLQISTETRDSVSSVMFELLKGGIVGDADEIREMLVDGKTEKEIIEEFKNKQNK